MSDPEGSAINGRRPGSLTTGGGHTSAPRRVLVVDDSALVREMMTALLLGEPGLEVATAADPIIAMGKMREAPPDVILLDLELPRMDGLTFLQKIMRERPVPVVVLSSFGARGSEMALRAMSEGAVDVVAKPALGVRGFLEEAAEQLRDVVRAALAARPLGPRALPSTTRLPLATPWPPLMVAANDRRPPPSPPPRLVAIAASTGGPDAVAAVLGRLPALAPGVVCVQHMPEGFTAAFARRLGQLCRVRVAEARDGDAVTPGVALIAPGNRHVTVARAGAGWRVQLHDGPLVSRHRPSADVLFQSVAQAAGAQAIGVILTGMGHDGADGLLAMRRAGALTIAQDEQSSVVFGMPREALRRGAVDEVLPLAHIGAALLRRP